MKRRGKQHLVGALLDEAGGDAEISAEDLAAARRRNLQLDTRDDGSVRVYFGE